MKINAATRTLSAISAMALCQLAGLGTTSAQTTNFVVNEFNSGNEVTNSAGFNGSANGWGNWFGSGLVSSEWDPTQDSGGSPHSGSMKVTANNTDQYLLFDGFFTFSVQGYPLGVFTNLQFDIRYDASSAIRTNGNSLDFGFVQIGAWSPGYNQDYFGGFQIPATNGAGQPNTNWVRINIPIDSNTDNNLTNITDLIFHVYHPGYGNQNMTGNSIYWVDNLQFTGPSSVTTPVPVMSIQKATPGLRIFEPGTITYQRNELATVDQQQSWIGAGGPVSYSFTLANYNPNIAQVHLELIPVSASSVAMYNNIFVDYNASNMVWLIINPLAGNQVTASIQWKTGLPGNNPNHTDLVITNSTAVGTWTLTFSSALSGTLTAPGASPVPFTLSDPSAATDFANPLVAYYGTQPNTSSGIGQYIDYKHISVSGVAGANFSDDFTTDSALDTSIWSPTTTGASAIWLVTANDAPFWLTWTTPAFGYDLGTKADLSDTNMPWYNPGYFAGYGDNPIVGQVGTTVWALIPNDCLPGGPTNAFFLLQNPPQY